MDKLILAAICGSAISIACHVIVRKIWVACVVSVIASSMFGLVIIRFRESDPEVLMWSYVMAFGTLPLIIAPVTAVIGGVAFLVRRHVKPRKDRR